MSTNYLHFLNIKHLMSILKHVQGGHAHLSRKLSQKEYQELLAIGNLSNNQIAHIESDKQEKVGNVSIVVNTILTSCFGAWLGFNGFNQTSIVSPFGIIIILAAISFGLTTGYLSYLFTHRQELLAIKNQKLRNVERVIIEIIINKRQKKVEALQEKIRHLLMEMDLVKGSPHDLSPKRILEAINKISFCKNRHPYYSTFKKALSSIKRNIHKLSHDETKAFHALSSFNSTDFLLNNALTNASYLRILIKPESISQHQIPKVNRWLRTNLTGVLVGLLPTFLGSFASMFVFLNGFPALFDALQIKFGFSSSHLSTLKEMGISTALAISLYFAYSHIHSNYKSYQRAKQLEISENKISEMSHQMLQLMTQVNSWYKIFYQLEVINIIYKNFLEKQESLAI